MTVMKFGGTSVQDAAAIAQLVKIVGQRSGRRLVIVSALAKVTDGLLRLAELCEAGDGAAAERMVNELRERHLHVGRELNLSPAQLEPITGYFSELLNLAQALSTLKEVTPRSRDTLASFGELCSSRLVQGALTQSGLSAEWIDSRQLIATDSSFMSAQVDWDKTRAKVRERFAEVDCDVCVGQGFIGADGLNHTTTLGRGGSDYSAAIYGACLQADRVEIWTDVNGILSTDPRLVENAHTIRRIHFSEAAEMAYFGAKVLHPATIYPALKEKIPVWVLNSKNPNDPGTEITLDLPEKPGVCGIAFKRNVTVVNIVSTRMLGAYGFLKSVFDVFARHKLSVDLIATSEVSVSLTLDPNFDTNALARAQLELAEIADVQVNGDLAIVSVIGRGIRETPGLAAKIFNEIQDINVRMISMGASELNVSFVVASAQAGEVVRRLHAKLLS